MFFGHVPGELPLLMCTHWTPPVLVFLDWFPPSMLRLTAAFMERSMRGIVARTRATYFTIDIETI
jgi:hypothetical protein